LVDLHTEEKVDGVVAVGGVVVVVGVERTSARMRWRRERRRNAREEQRERL
jgi:hypothetical protein